MGTERKRKVSLFNVVDEASITSAKMNKSNGSGRGAAARSSVASFRVLTMAIAVAVVFVFSLSFVFTSRTDSSDLSDSGFDSGSFGGFGSTRRTVLALKSDPLKSADWTRSGSRRTIIGP